MKKLCSATELPGVGAMRSYKVGNQEVCVANEGGRLAAVDNLCPHRQGPLAEGTLENGQIVCPWHAWAFDLQTGHAAQPAGALVQVFPLETRGDAVWIALGK